MDQQAAAGKQKKAKSPSPPSSIRAAPIMEEVERAESQQADVRAGIQPVTIQHCHVLPAESQRLTADASASS